MRSVLLILDGATDLPVDDLDGKTPLEAARTPNLDRLAQRGRVGRTMPVPEEWDLAPDVAVLSLLGYDPQRYYTGVGPVDAAAMQVPLAPRDVAFRMNLVSVDGEKMPDHTAGRVSTEEALPLLEALRRVFHTNDARRIYPGAGHRHLMVWTDGPVELRCTPPDRVAGQHFLRFMPEGDRDQSLRRKMWDSFEVLDGHEVNQRRRDAGKPAANMIWPWGPGRAPDLPLFPVNRGVQGVILAASGLAKGVGHLAGLTVLEVPGLSMSGETGLGTMARVTLDALREGRSFAALHLSGPNEAAYRGDAEAKLRAIERIDEDLLDPLLPGLGALGPFRLLIVPSCSTPVELRRREGHSVPFLIYDSEAEKDSTLPFDERGMRDTRFRIPEGHRLIDLLFQ